MAAKPPNAPFTHVLQAALGCAIMGLLLYSWISLIYYLEGYRAVLGLNIGAVGLLTTFSIALDLAHY
jgi:hypothetical protein